MNPDSRILAVFAAGLITCMTAAGCPKRTEQAPIETRRAPDAPESPPASDPTARSQPVADPPATQPSPATQPVATQPESTYDPRPPYPVMLHVRHPDEKQPGWLRVMALADDKLPATAAGTFPERNHIYVNTGNVAELRLHIGQLPLAHRQRIILHIDGQNVELWRKDREFVSFQRSPAGVWGSVKSSE